MQVHVQVQEICNRCFDFGGISVKATFVSEAEVVLGTKLRN